MAIIFEDSAKVTKKQIPIPQNAKNVFKAMKKIYEPYLDKNIPGSKILKSLGSDKKYNKKGANAQTNGKEIKQDSVNVNDAKVRLHRMNKLPKNSIQYQLNGGELAANIYRKGIERARGTKEVEAVKPPKPTTNADLKPADTKSETIKTPSGKITYTVTAENRVIKESLDNEEHPFYEYLEEYDVNYVLDDFFENPKGKQNWGVLINPEMYAKALREFTQYGKLVKFPSKYVYQWMGIIMKNTAILETNSAIAGHREYSRSYEIAEYINDNFGEEIEPNYESCSDWLEEQGLYDWMEMPDGHFAVTDYGTGPLFKIIKEYNEDLPPEKVLVLVNRALDVYHMQGPICSIFIQGGTKSLDKIAEHTQKSKKKVYITERQIVKLRHGKYIKQYIK